MKMKKKGQIVQAFLALIVLAVILIALPGTIYGGTDGVWSLTKKLFSQSVPEPKGLSSAEISDSSIKALVLALNHAASKKSLYEDKNYLKDNAIFPKKYKITYYAQIELKEDDSGKTENQKKIFSSEFPIESETYLNEEWLVFADFLLNDAKAKSYEQFYERIKEAYSNIDKNAPVKQLENVYNIELEAEYANGKKCVINTISDQEAQYDTQSTDELSSMFSQTAADEFSSFDLATWGSWSNNCATLDECDKNDNGVPGKFLDTHVGKDIKDVLNSGMQKEVQKYGLSDRFPNGKIDINSEEGCLDSPTWLECPGIRIYYCGKYGFNSGQSRLLTREDKDYFLTEGEDIHSRSAIKILRVFDESFDGKLSDDKKSFIRHSNGEIVESSTGFAAVERDGIYRWIADAIEQGVKSSSKKAQAELDDPRISCDGGETFGNSRLKCDIYGCNLCNFELTQEYIDDAKLWIGGNLDPQYLIYYQAFPPLDEEGWIPNLLKTMRPNQLKIPHTQASKTETQYAAQISDYIRSNIDFKEEKIKNEYAFSQIFFSASQVLKYSDKEDATEFLDHAQKISSSILMDLDLVKSTDELMAKNTLISKAYDEFKKALGPSNEYATPYAFAIFFLTRDELDRKFYSQGTNLFIKNPFKEANPITEKLAGTGVSLGDAAKYYIQLTKDSSAERFYLASPCKTDLKIIKTKCECFIPDDKSITMYRSNGESIPVLTSSMNGDPSKYITTCINPRSVSEQEQKNPKNRKIEIDCLEVHPVMGSSLKNYCYFPISYNWNTDVNKDTQGIYKSNWPNHWI